MFLHFFFYLYIYLSIYLIIYSFVLCIVPNAAQEMNGGKPVSMQSRDVMKKWIHHVQKYIN